jgi:hypothetical protein
VTAAAPLRRARPLVALAALLCACATDAAPAPDGAADTAIDTAADTAPALGPPPTGTRAAFDLARDLHAPDAFFAQPWPSDLRTDALGRPDVTGLPNPRDLDLIEDLREVASDGYTGFPTTSVAWFHFDAPLAPRSPSERIAPSPDADLLLVDVDPASPDRGRLFPLVAATLPPDLYVPENLLALAPYPGVVIPAGRRYAYLVRRPLGDAAGAPLGVSPAVWALLHGAAPDGPRAADALALFAPLRDTLAALAIPADSIAAATVFTTADVALDLSTLGDRVLAAYAPTISAPAPDPDDGLDHPRFCELQATITLPQFQQGTPPFDGGGGRFAPLGPDGLPPLMRQETIPLTITIPRARMPPAGYPICLYHHGSGGLSSQVVDRGPVTEPGGTPQKGLGPAHVLAAHAIAAAGYALPINPERVPGASSLDYLNLGNLSAYTDTVRQGSLEGRLVLDALLRLRIPAATLAACAGASLPPDVDAATFDPGAVLAMGQSQGGFYATMFAALEPRVRAVVPTGTGGFWSQFILTTEQFPGAALISGLLGTAPDLSALHPAMHLLQMAWEPAETMPYMQRIARRPLPGHPVRHVYQPVGRDDHFYPVALFDALALAFEHQQAGDLVWPSMQQALGALGLDGLIAYPVSRNRPSLAGGTYTGVVVQYEGDGLADPHAIFAQLDAVKYQYGCFFESLLATGVATVPKPAPLGTPCPHVAP